jgi:integrase
MKIKLWKHTKTGVYYVVWMEKGKQRRRSLKTKDRVKANKRKNRFIEELMSGKVKSINDGYDHKFYSFAGEYEKHIEAVSPADATVVIYKTTLKYAKRSIGNIPLAHITTRHIDSFLTDLLTSGLKPPTVNKHRRHLKAILNTAYEWEYMNKVRKFPKPIPEITSLKYFTDDQLSKLLSVVDDQEFLDFCFFSAVTGMRSGEQIRLKWSDIDNPPGYIRISPKQKNKEEQRIPLNDTAREILDKYKKDVGKVFRFRTESWVSQKFKAYVRKAELPDHFHFHSLRHTFGTQAIASGVDVRTLQKLMRHASIDTTLIYADVFPNHLVEASNKIKFKLKNQGKIVGRIGGS